MKIIAKRIRDRRHQLKLKQDQLATLTQMSQAQISRYERGGNIPAGESLRILTIALETSSDYLLGIVDDPTPYEDRDGLSTLEMQLLAAYRRRDVQALLKIIFED
jgi:transcriptional regulator with XRE-family HTH domain